MSKKPINKNGIVILDPLKKKAKPRTSNKNLKILFKDPDFVRNVRPITQMLWDIQKEKCWYCGARISQQHATIDHKKPQVSGGTDTYGNCVVSCNGCNHEKSARTVGEYRRYKGKNNEFFFYSDSNRHLFQVDLANHELSNTKFNPIVVPNFPKKSNGTIIQRILPLF
jgi:5-methylcytosine-specific restriction endonuclease McrA